MDQDTRVVYGIIVRYSHDENIKHIDAVFNYLPFLSLIKKLVDEKKFVVADIIIRGIDMFGPRVGFVNLKINVTDEAGAFLPGIVFMRGGSVGVLTLLKCKSESVYNHENLRKRKLGDVSLKYDYYIVLTSQARIPVGESECLEITAGMLDGSGNVAFIASKEMKEELAIDIDSKKLIPLTEAIYEDGRGMYPSPGGCDEDIHLFAYCKEVNRDELETFNGRLTGLREEGEKISLKLVKYEEAHRFSRDSKLLSAMFIYEKLYPNGL